jgi:hypothetical protein
MHSLNSVEHQPSIPACVTSDDVVEELLANACVMLAHLESPTTLHVRTTNSVYRIVVVEGSTTTVQGGVFFKETTAVDFKVSSLGDGRRKIGSIKVGSRMEICAGGHCIVTSPVRAIRTER